MGYQLLIGNKNYSSWSLRSWLILKAFDIPFEEINTRLETDDFKFVVPKYSPTGLVPALIDGDTIVWDSLAIAEYLAEKHPGLWPSDFASRTLARCMCAEMHSGFRNLRTQMPMAVRTTYPITPEPEVVSDIARIEALWSEARRRSQGGGPYLFGSFSIADAYFAPVIWRFNTYGIKLNPICSAYAETMRSHPAMQQWRTDAIAEKEVVAHDEPAHIYGTRKLP